MDWSDVGTAIGKVAPILGNALVGNVPGAVAGAAALVASAFGVDATPSAVSAAITADPGAAEKLAEVESNNKVAIQALLVTGAANQLTADTARIQAVNATFQADAAGKSWIQTNYHGISILMSVGAVIGVYFVLPLFGDTVPVVPESAWFALATFTGVAAWQRGKTDQAKVVAAS